MPDDGFCALENSADFRARIISPGFQNEGRRLGYDHHARFLRAA